MYLDIKKYIQIFIHVWQDTLLRLEPEAETTTTERLKDVMPPTLPPPTLPPQSPPQLPPTLPPPTLPPPVLPSFTQPTLAPTLQPPTSPAGSTGGQHFSHAVTYLPTYAWRDPAGKVGSMEVSSVPNFD